jgi:biopolymer transport protein ExbD
MTPMIDVVFLLIIFFLVSSHLAKQEGQLELPLPEAESGSQLTDDGSPRAVVNVLADGTLLLAGSHVTPLELEQRLGFEQQRIRQARGAGANIEVRIRGDRRVPYRFVEPIMLAAFRQDISDVTFAVYRSEDVPK